MNAYCQHQGKILALFWVMRSGNDLLISFPLDLLDSIKSRLQMFVLMSDVIITDVTKQFLQIGAINISQKDSLTINEQLSLILTGPKNLSKFDLTSQDHWDKACIDSFLPEVSIASTETYIPQMLNLDINEVGVNFSKGCFPGQEVVARLHYLGKAKRRLFAFKSDFPLSINDTLHCAESKSAKASGSVVSQVKFGSDFYCLATLEVENKDNKITINNDQGPTLTRIHNE
uniref:Conserved domain protein n=1 Tax=uncultured marine bacterium 560 TaxID=257395 RepID=Q6SGE1_9BACT|nr:conserved domain protein [uncultured marine bacterium 560]